MNRQLQKEILECEKKLLSPEFRNSEQELLKTLADDFLEIGKSGRKYSKADVIALLTEAGSSHQVLIQDFHVSTLAEHLVLATYKTAEGASGNMVLRSSIWERKKTSGWQIRFHQGTKVAG